MRLPRGVYERNGIMYIRFQDGRGNLVRESTHQSSAKVAEDVLAKRRTEVAEGTFFPARRFDKITFSELLSTWWDEHGQYTRSCFRYLRHRVEGYFGPTRARDVRVANIRAFFGDLANRGYSAAYVNSHRTMLNSIFNHAKKTGSYDTNPVTLVPQLRERERTRLLKFEEWQRLLTACDGDSELRCFVILAALTTMRKSEILQRPWKEVHLDGAFPYVEIPITKNNDPKIIPLPAAAVHELRGLPSFGRSAYVFPAKATHRYPNVSALKKAYRWDIRQAFVAACRKAELDDVHIHDLRHLGPSILLAQGVADSVVAKVTGHRSAALRRYQHLSDSFRKHTVDLIATVLMTQATDTRTDTPSKPVLEETRPRGCKAKTSKGLNGRPERTRTVDLYRVKVVPVDNLQKSFL
ncbi:MAG TPA: site-specific integrase [Terriglobia bacterium]|nr:site-specific integrase [Terriglobia bacterium]